MNLENKKTSIGLIIISVILTLITFLAKSVKSDRLQEWFYYQEKKVSVGTDFYCINFFGYELPYTFVLSVLIISFGIGVYLIIYKTDLEIKNAINKVVHSTKNVGAKLLAFTSTTRQTTSESVIKLKDIKINRNSEYEKYISYSLVCLVIFIPLCFFEYYVEIENYFIVALAIITFFAKKIIAFIITRKLTSHIKGEAWFWKLLSICFPTITLFILSNKFFEKEGLIIKSS